MRGLVNQSWIFFPRPTHSRPLFYDPNMIGMVLVLGQGQGLRVDNRVYKNKKCDTIKIRILK